MEAFYIVLYMRKPNKIYMYMYFLSHVSYLVDVLQTILMLSAINIINMSEYISQPVKPVKSHSTQLFDSLTDLGFISRPHAKLVYRYICEIVKPFIQATYYLVL